MLVDLDAPDFTKSMKNASDLLDLVRKGEKSYSFEEYCSNLSERLEESIQGKLSWKYCSAEYKQCECNAEDTIQIRYGSSKNDKWAPAISRSAFSGATPCSNKTFGDPIPYVTKECHC